MSRFFKFGKLHVTKGNGDKLLDILLTASKKLKRSLAPTGNGNVKKCAVGKHPKSEKLGSTGQAACCARIHSRYFTGGNPSGLRV